MKTWGQVLAYSRPRTRRFAGARAQRLSRVELLERRDCLSLAVPAFSSLPGANHVIYLDFDGHVTSGTTWNTGYYGEEPINSPAWSLDADRANFSDTELATIERVWRRVSEDFSPFQINVTTVEPANGDLRKGEVANDVKWGVRAVVTIETTTVRCGCGGIAYIGAFNDFYDEPVFVYNASESGVAEAISHEVGHSLGLSHDGTKGADLTAGTADDVSYYAGHGSGATSWAPIMGNSYNRNVTTWDRGEYYNANNGGTGANYNAGPDDLSIVVSQNGFGYRADDYGNTLATAATLSGPAISANGLIAQRTDVDLFKFTTGAGAVSLNVTPASLRANLDVKAELLDAAGAVVATSNPVDALNATFALTLTAGTYYLRVDGTGVGDPTSSTPTGYSDYASIGQYSVSGTIIDPGLLPELTVDDVTIVEGSGTASFTVRLSGAITQDVTVSYATADGTAAAGSDYTTTAGTLTFVPGGPTTQTVSVSVANDALAEATETFQLLLSGVSSNALITDGAAVASIANDDATLRINDTSVTEGNVNRRGVPTNTTATFTISLAQPVNRAVTVNYSTGKSGDTATANVDYLSKSGAVTIPAGQSSVAITVTVVGDNTKESNETFSVVLTSVELVTDDTGVGTIVDNDSGKKGATTAAAGVAGGVATSANYVGDFTRIDETDLAEPGDDDEHDHGLFGHHHHDEADEAPAILVLAPLVGVDDASRSTYGLEAFGTSLAAVTLSRPELEMSSEDLVASSAESDDLATWYHASDDATTASDLDREAAERVRRRRSLTLVDEIYAAEREFLS